MPFLHYTDYPLALILLKNNPIEHLELCDVSFLSDYQLANAVNSCNLKSLSLGFSVERLNNELSSLLIDLCGASFWKDLTTLSIKEIYVDVLYLILKSIGDYPKLKNLKLDVIMEVADFESLPRLLNIKSLKLCCSENRKPLASKPDRKLTRSFDTEGEERNYPNSRGHYSPFLNAKIKKTYDGIRLF